jgi:hypothetical protein
VIKTTGRWLVGAMLAVIAAGCGETPATAYQAIGAAAERGDWGAVYDRIDTRSRARLDRALVFAGLDAASETGEVDQAKFEEIRATGGRALFIRMATANPAFARVFLPLRVLSVRIVGDAAEVKVVQVVQGQVTTRAVPMVREGGVWKLAPAARRPRP